MIAERAQALSGTVSPFVLTTFLKVARAAQDKMNMRNSPPKPNSIQGPCRLGRDAQISWDMNIFDPPCILRCFMPILTCVGKTP